MKKWKTTGAYACILSLILLCSISVFSDCKGLKNSNLQTPSTIDSLQQVILERDFEINRFQVSLEIINTANDSLQSKIKLLENKSDSLQALIKSEREKAILNATIVQNVKNYVKITDARPANKTYFFGWIKRAVSE